MPATSDKPVEHRCSCGLTFATAARLGTHIQKWNGKAHLRGDGHRKVETPPKLQLAYLPRWLNWFERRKLRAHVAA